MWYLLQSGKITEEPFRVSIDDLTTQFNINQLDEKMHNYEENSEAKKGISVKLHGCHALKGIGISNFLGMPLHVWKCWGIN